MTDKEIRLRCFEMASEYSKDRSLDDIFEIAEKIYEFACKNDDIIGQSDEVNWDAYKEKLRENNRRVKINM